MTKWLLPLLAACVGPYPDDETVTDTSETIAGAFEPKAFFIYPGSDSDRGWSNSHDSARAALESSLGIETNFATLVTPTDAEGVIQGALDEDYNVIVTASSDYIPSALVAAAGNEDSFFLSCCGSQSTDNLTSYFGRMYQPLYVAGYVAATKSCTGRLGVVAAKPIPQFIRHINAFLLGAREANPNAVIEVLWLNSFFDPEREALLANELMDHGVDVVLVQTNSNIAVAAAAERTVTCQGESPVWSVGYHSAEMCDADPIHCITSAYWNWEPYYANRIQSMVDGTFDPSNVSWQPWLDGSDSVVQLLPWAAAVDTPTAIDADNIAANLRSSPSAPFDRLTRSALGNTMITNGQSYSDEELDQMCWLVEGSVTWTSAGDVPAEAQGCVGIQDAP